jgi:hypothetical protein
MTPQSISGATAGVGVISSILGGFGAYESGRQQKAAYDYNAQITLQNTQAEMASSTQAYTARIGKQASSYAASGVDIASGSPLMIMAATAARGGQQGAQILEQGTEKAALERYYGSIAAFSGTMGGIGTFLSGISKTASTYGGSMSSSQSVPSAPLSMFNSLFVGAS